MTDIIETTLLRLRANFKQLNSMIKNHSKCGSSRRTLSYLQTRLELVNDLFRDIRNDNNIVSSSNDDAALAYIDSTEYSLIEEIFISFKTDLLELMLPLQQAQAAPVVPNVAQNEQSNIDFRLPTISIPTFSGDYNAWPSFKNSFEHLVAFNRNLSNLQRLHYLKNSLAGDAKKLVQHYDIIEANYQAAWEKLTMRYNNKKLLVSGYLKSLLHQAGQTKESASHIRTLLDSVSDSLNGLRNVGIPTDQWDPIIIHILIEKLSNETHALWEATQMAKNELPPMSELVQFLESRCRTLEAIADKPSGHYVNPFNSNSKQQSHSQRHAYSHNVSSDYTCIMCNENHVLRQCPSFLQMDSYERVNIARQYNACINCLGLNHSTRACPSKMNCNKCNKRHHSLLHHATVSSSDSPVNPPNQLNDQQTRVPHSAHVALSTDQESSSTVENTNFTHLATPLANTVLLATACVNVATYSGEFISLRALIDPGSQVSFITNKAINQLQLKPKSTNAKIFGIGQMYSGTSTKSVNVTFASKISPTTQMNFEFLTIPKITGSLPPSTYEKTDWSHIKNIPLADPHYNRSGPIDLLLNAEIYSQIILPGLQRGDPNEPVAQYTSLGWILFGGSSAPKAINSLSLHTCIEIDDRLRSFWESEEVSSTAPPVAADDLESENQFCTTYKRNESGRFIVRLPFNDTNVELGHSRDVAVRRLLQMETKFAKNSQLFEDYKNFMAEYETLGHMKRVTIDNSANYIPHHSVIKTTSSTTKLRVVFDASQKTGSGKSLNDYLRVGPTIQNDLVTLLTRWRKYPIAFTADLEKMYRQILVDDQDQSFQRIVWRSSPTADIQDFKLQTITYGTACAQFLAIRSMHQLAFDGAQSFPKGSKVMIEDFYVDDLLSGTYDIPEAIEIQSQLRNLAQTGGFNLRKWSSNHDEVLKAIPPCDREIKTVHLFEFDDTIKSLGIHWNPCTDKFTFQSALDASTVAKTKRSILSEMSKLFDPLGWVSPIIIQAKILMQKIWLIKATWDEPLPPSIIDKWRLIRKDFLQVHLIELPRSMFHSINQPIELHGFSDASIHAFAAVVYARTTQDDGSYIVTLIAAKTKVAPVKQITLPRLELCGAHLLSKLITKIKTILKIDNIKTYGWCDSTIVLHWMRGHPNRLKTFVANRVSDILEQGHIVQWRHVSGKENPADCASRGLDIISLQHHPLWWKGPSWLSQHQSKWPVSALPEVENLPDVKLISMAICKEDSAILALIGSKSSPAKLIRIVAYLIRFARNCKQPNHRKTGPLNAIELKGALHQIIANVQMHEFSSEYHNLQAGRLIHHRSHIMSLNPFIDQDNVLRVGGRLKNANISFDMKHPIILPKGHHFTKILIHQMHLNTLHGGPELVITMLRRRYWIVNMRSAVRLQIYKCITCFRFNAKRCSQIMGNLPNPRVHIERPFTHTGIDCAGPIDLRMSKGRGAKSYKGYITLFICLGTKAVHIEAVSDMSTPAFLAAYRRFCSRRGYPQHCYSDNGTNFVGASKIIRKDAGAHLLNISTDIINEVTMQGSVWHFIPPAAPHFGGLWEAGIKSIKQHFKRIIGHSTLTFEELSTLLNQIEACLNSRPICPTTSDPSDNSALTPGHFLIGDALLAPPEGTSDSINTNILTRWQLVQKLKNDFWNRWQREYLIRLQQRPKWATKRPNVAKNDLVLVIEDNLPPSRWIMGRVLETHAGTDGMVRVATIRCNNSTIKRPIAKLALLPTFDQFDHCAN